MSTLQQHHKILNEAGVEKCSVPMWSGGSPAGFCDADAYGKRPYSPMRMNYCAGQMMRDAMPFMGWKCPWFDNPRDAIRAAMSREQSGG